MVYGGRYIPFCGYCMCLVWVLSWFRHNGPNPFLGLVNPDAEGKKGQKIVVILNICLIMLCFCVHCTCTRSQPTAVWRMHNNLRTRQGSDQLGPAKATLLLYNHFIVLYHWGVTVETIVEKLQLPNQCLILCTLGNSASATT